MYRNVGKHIRYAHEAHVLATPKMECWVATVGGAMSYQYKDHLDCCSSASRWREKTNGRHCKETGETTRT